MKGFKFQLKVNYPETIILKSDGANASEKYLSALCNDTFLSLWSYPNLFRDEGRTDNKGDGKEICDLLVVFERHVIIFSDKMWTFPSTDDICLNWSRWYKKTIRDAEKQIRGAENHIKRQPDNIYLDSLCQRKLPIKLPNKSDAIYHRIVVAHGASEACKQYFSGGSGSLIIDTSIQGERHWRINGNDIAPFCVGQVNPSNGFVHVFDDVSLGIVMQTLDTVSDFVKYLDCKEIFLQSKYINASGEEELLAEYLKNTDSHGRRSFISDIDDNDNVAGLTILEGNWLDFCEHPSRLAQIEANKVSYLWDGLIQKFLFHLTTGTSESISHPIICEQEAMFRIMAREDRTHRRALSEALLDLFKNTPTSSRTTRVVFAQPTKTCYLFFLLPYMSGHTYEEYREVRKQLLSDYVYIVKSQIPNALDIIGIAFETHAPESQNHSEDLVYLDARSWTSEDQEQAERLEQEFIEKGLLSSRSYYYKTIDEYPDIDKKRYKGRDRNKPCPCGSRKKYKKCCGTL